MPIEHTRVVSTDGFRRRYRDALKDSRFAYPRKSLNHPLEWYMDDAKVAARPTVGLYSLARFAEYLLHMARFGRHGQQDAITHVAEFFAATRRAMQNVLSTYPINTRLSGEDFDSVRAKVCELAAMGRVAYGHLNHLSRRVECMVCHGNGSLPMCDAELLAEILYEQSRAGRIPRTSRLYIEPRLTPSTEL